MLLGLNRNTINRYYGVFRQVIFAWQEKQKDDFARTVEVDESYFGQTRPRGAHTPLKRGRSTTKQPVFDIFEHGGGVYIEVVPDAKKLTLQRVIRGQVSLDSVIISDGWRGYNRLVDVGFDSIYASKRPSMTKQGMSETVFTSMALKASGHSPNEGSQNSMV
jgi:transposase-like protein